MPSVLMPALSNTPLCMFMACSPQCQVPTCHYFVQKAIPAFQQDVELQETAGDRNNWPNKLFKIMLNLELFLKVSTIEELANCYCWQILVLKRSIGCTANAHKHACNIQFLLQFFKRLLSCQENRHSVELSKRSMCMRPLNRDPGLWWRVIDLILQWLPINQWLSEQRSWPLTEGNCFNTPVVFVITATRGCLKLLKAYQFRSWREGY